jgi:hypothetical protein
MVLKALKVFKVSKEPMVVRVLKVLGGPLVPEVAQGRKELKVFKASKEPMGLKAFKEPMGLKDTGEH